MAAALSAGVLLFASAAEAATPMNRVVRAVNTQELTQLHGNVHPLARAEFDKGEAPASLPTGRMLLWLRRDAAQETELRQFLSDVQSPASPNYRKWLTPESYGEKFGISSNDLDAVEKWLQGSGLIVEKVSTARNAIVFSGNVSSVESAFHTSIHSFAIGKKMHFSNTSDPQIPAALAPVIAGISPMNDFYAKSQHVRGKPAKYDAVSKRIRPELTGGDPTSGFVLYVGPADASIIYDTPNQNFNPAATQTLDGTGVTLGIVGYSALATNNIQNYRTAFLSQANAANMPVSVLDGGIDPGVIAGDAADEALLDTEIAGGLAPAAKINYYYAASSNLSDGLTLAVVRALEDNQVNILSASYGNCEASLGAGGNFQWSELWEQAAAQGITVTVSSGDSGSASCDEAGAGYSASLGLSVSGMASTPFNIAVGGTDYYTLTSNFGQYVNNTSGGSYPYYATALSYIPETPWNDSSGTVGVYADNTPADYDGYGDTDIIAGGGGISSQAVCPGALDAFGNCSQALAGYALPPFQTGFTPPSSAREIPDVSLLAANGDYGAIWLFCTDAITDGYDADDYTYCQTDPNGELDPNSEIGGIGGTSAAAPAFAGMLALVSQSRGGARLGQANNVLYNLAQDYNPSPSSPGKYQRAFHDVTTGNISVYCVTGSPDCGSNNFLNGYNATPSYDAATGLGSVDLLQLIALWSSATFTSTSNSVTAGTSASALGTGSIHAVHGTPLYFQTAVAPGDATGGFSMLTTSSASPASFNDYGTLGGNGIGQLVVNDLPGGTYTVSAYYAGDSTHSASQSGNSIDVAITAEPSTTTLSFGAIDPANNAQIGNVTTLAYGLYSFVTAQPYGNSSPTDGSGNIVPDGIPTGSVTFTTNGSSNTVALNSLGVAQISTITLAPGSYTYQASYPGDASFEASSSPSSTFTITKAPTTLALTPSATSLSSGDTLTLTAVLNTDSIAAYPIGNGVATANGHTYYAAMIIPGETGFGGDQIAWTFTIPATSLAEGSNTITVSYGGDPNYQGISSTVTVSVTGAVTTPGTFALSGPAAGVSVAVAHQVSANITITPSNGFGGDVTLNCTVSAASSGTTPSCQGIATTISGMAPVTAAIGVTTYADTPTGQYTITVSGVNGLQTQTTTVPLTVISAPGFSLAAAASAVTIAAPGQSGTDGITVTPVSGFTGTVNLACSVAAASGNAAPSCSISSTVAITGTTAASATLTINTTAPSTARNEVRHLPGRPMGVVTLALLLACVISPRRRRLPLLSLLVLAGVFGVVGCGGSGNQGGGQGTIGTAPGTYTVAVTAASGTQTVTTNVTVTVQ